MKQLSEIPDEQLVERILQGETHLFEQFLIRYNQRLYRLGLSIVRNPDTTEEIMQSAYVKAFENLSRFENRSLFSTWLTRILINEGLMHLRQKKRREEMSELLTDNMTDHLHPLHSLINNELKDALENAIMGLPQNHRMVFMMREIEGLSINETAELMNISEANVKVAFHRAKNQLRQSLIRQYKQTDFYTFHLSRCALLRKRVMERIVSKVKG